ncbi:MAG: histidine kinase [Bacteroidia bacterium]|nr:histidine kinase [Bacteroidia bacterium]
MKALGRFFFHLFWVFTLSSCLLSCEKKSEPNSDLTPWYGRKTMQEHFKWYFNADNYFDSNYHERFFNLYNHFLESNQEDSALYYLLVYSDMVDQNYINDSIYLTTAKNHLYKYESVNTYNGELLKLYYYISSQYATMVNNDSCEAWALRGLEKKEMPARFVAKCHRVLSGIYSFYSNQEKAIPHSLAFLDYFVQKQDTLNIGVAYFNLALLYEQLYAFEATETYMKKALEYSLMKKDTYTIAIYYNHLGHFYYKTNKDSSKYVLYADKLNDILNNYSNKMVYLHSLNENVQITKFFITKQFDSIPRHLERFKELGIMMEDSVTKKNYYIQKVRYEIQKSGKVNNENELLEIIEYAKANNDKDLAYSSYNNLYNHAFKNGDYKKALDYQNEMRALELENFKKNSKGQIYDKEVRYQNAKKDEEILVQAEKLKIKQRNIGLLLAGLIILILAFILYFIWQKKKTITEKSRLETLFTQKLMENTEDERMRIAKDLHDSIGHELLNVRSAITNKMQFTEEKIDHILEEVREISRNLFPVMFAEVGLKISIEQLIDQLNKSEGLYVMSEVNYVSGTLDAKSELNIYRIIQEALNNVRKYAGAQSAKVFINQTNEGIKVEIMDNGKGFDVNDVLKSGKAFGLMSIHQRCIALKSEATIHSDANGTIVSFQIHL